MYEFMTMTKKSKGVVAFLLLLTFLCGKGLAQSLDADEIKKLIETFKKDQRGPYQAIRWFCPDGTILPANQRCKQQGGIQHALHKDVVEKLAKEQGIYLGQILAGTPFHNFLDTPNNCSRMKQYQMEKYLQLIDDGWILRRGRYYRGAIQGEDEENWGSNFLKWLINDEALQSRFFLIRQAGKDIPHGAYDERWEKIRAMAKVIAEQFPLFSELRVKLHGQPERPDLQKVKEFQTKNKKNLPAHIDDMLDNLITELDSAFQPTRYLSLSRYFNRIPPSSPIRDSLKRLIDTWKNEPPVSPSGRMGEIAHLLWDIRKGLLAVRSSEARLAMIDLSNELEALFFLHIGSWEPRTIGELLTKTYTIAKALTGCGFLEMWEWEMVEPSLAPMSDHVEIPFLSFMEKADSARRIVEWGAGMVRAHYEPVVDLFFRFEPLAAGFIDDRIHSSLLLPLGEVTGRLTALMNHFTGAANHVFDISNQHSIRGVNPGFAVGELVVVTGPVNAASLERDKIYVLSESPADIRPVAGILSVCEGNLVSHVQLLARNLGIPNAVLSQRNMKDLMPYSGRRVFYAVSPRGAVLIKPANEITPEERDLVMLRKIQTKRIRVPVEKIDVKRTDLISLKTVRSSDSGKFCGPKAANLGELKNLFPERVVNGLVIPFGVFRNHLNQPMPEMDMTYWELLQEIFDRASAARKNEKKEEDIEKEILQSLSVLRHAIRRIPLAKDFEENLCDAFAREFSVEMGGLPVFIRSDTNMEDLKGFTGAGLNLTVFNVLTKEEIIQAIKDVWASPFTERSYQWRQRYMMNPQNVYPSLLVLPSVNVEKSGVMITTGIPSSIPEDTTVAFSRGVGGAVEGQVAESYLLRKDGGIILLSPSREMQYTELLPNGGVKRIFTALNMPILRSIDVTHLFDLSNEIRKKMPQAWGSKTAGPFDVELGFKRDRIWLFQVRPFAENRSARAGGYLRRMDPNLPENMRIILTQPIEGFSMIDHSGDIS